MGAVSKAIAGAFQAFGGELRTEAGVDNIIVKNGRATGVALENGEEIVLHKEPDTTTWKRFKTRFLSLIVQESQL